MTTKERSHRYHHPRLLLSNIVAMERELDKEKGKLLQPLSNKCPPTLLLVPNLLCEVGMSKRGPCHKTYKAGQLVGRTTSLVMHQGAPF